MNLRYAPDPDGLMPGGPATGPDRRRFRRHALDRPVKLRCDATGRTYHAEGVDASAGGVLLRVEHDRGFPIGQPLRVGIPPRRDTALLLADDLADARVVRCLSHGDARYVAIAFDVPVFHAEAG